ncbi:MAG: phenylalanine--tRNA ligase subunit beta [Thermoleophilia bacterium]|nr:phenylalanine--tRNA ligase subunit beta [Thermoleophilia bacterium]
MKVPLEWLREVMPTDLSDTEIADRLTATGTAVETTITRGIPVTDGNREAFRVGKVLTALQHPDADRLHILSVDTGEGAPRPIVCGAANVAAGQTVAVAIPGAVLPDGHTLSAATLRGVESLGMVCSASELEVPGESDGIMVLSDDLVAGTSLLDVLPSAGTILELELTPNRGDCQGIVGIAREVHAITGEPLPALDLTLPPETGPGQVGDYVSVTVEATDLCPRYMTRVCVDVAVGPSPAWLVRRLNAAGMRSINNVVDITNYVMLLTAQPLHAFDLDRLAGPAIVVRRAAEGERITTLDGHERTLSSDHLVIADAERPAVIAGIVGAAFAEVAVGTTRVLLEAATFDGPTIIHTSLGLGLRTESSARFEKGQPRELPPVAMAIACRLMHELAAAALVPGVLDVYEPAPTRAPIALRHQRVADLLGVDIGADESAGILQRLGCTVTPATGAHMVEVPWHRAGDLQREIDLIEEVGRIHGFDRIPGVLPRVTARARLTPAQSIVRRVTRRAADLGLSETISYRFVAEQDADRLCLPGDDSRRHVVRLSNALSDEMAVMRRSLVPGLLRAVERNQRHQRRDGGIFEVGRTYAPAADGLADEPEEITAVLFGAPGARGWRQTPGDADVWAATGLAIALARAAGLEAIAEPGSGEPYLHPVRQAHITVGGRGIGIAGEVHPLVCQAFDVTGPVVIATLRVAGLTDARPTAPRTYVDLISVPVSTRDLAVIIPDSVPAARVIEVVRASGGELVHDVEVFDHYDGDQVPAGHVSLAVRTYIAAPGRTLTDDEIDAVTDRAVTALEQAVGATLRS